MTYQFKIQIDGFKNPEVWRRIEIPADWYCHQFHKVIAAVFQKQSIDDTYYVFSHIGKETKPPICPFDEFSELGDYFKSSKTITIKEEVTYLGQTLEYYQNKSDDWQHIIVLEKIIPQKTDNSVCIAGEGAFPPIYCSGPEEYDDIKQALLDENHPLNPSIREWLGLDENETWEEKYKFDITKANENITLIDAEAKTFRNYTIVGYDTFDEKYGLNNSIWEIIDAKNIEISEWKNIDKIFNELKILVEKYPDIPHLRNMLSCAYLKNGKKKQFFEIAEQILAQYPDYVMTRCTLANQYTDMNKLHKTRQLLGEKFDLNEIYPTRNGRFTETEIFNYHIAVFRHYFKTEDEEEARKHFNFLEYLFTKEINQTYFPRMLRYLHNKKTTSTEEIRWMKVIPEKIKQTKKEPILDNPDILFLYRYSAFINKDILYRIMKLPRETLIKDLEKILIDSIARFDYYRKQNVCPDASIHALILLSELQAEESLDTLFTVLRQNDAYYDFWYSDMLTEDFWRFIYAMGQNKLEKLKDFMMEPNRDTFVRSAIANAVVFIAHHQPERKEETIKWFEDVIQYLIDNKRNKNIFERNIYSYLLEYLLDIAERKHFQLFLRLYDEKLLYEENHYTLHKIKTTLSRPMADYKVRELFDTIDDYYDRWQTFYSSDGNDDEDEEYDEEDDDYPIIVPSAATKIGRNEPCPCGSGKKYKKCCIDKK